MNTIWADTDGTHDDLMTTADVLAWLPTKTSCTRAELTWARLLRDALRRLAASVTDDARQDARSPVTDLDEAITVVNDLAAAAQPDQLAVHKDRLTLATLRATATAALADIAAEAIQLLAAPNAESLHACLAPGCVRYFTKSHPRREWCSEACGNRVRAARHYQRVRATR